MNPMKHITLVAALMLAHQIVASTAPQMAGFEIGEKIDILDKNVRSERHLAAPMTETLAQVKYSYFTCDATKPAEGYDEVSVAVSTNKTVLCIYSTVKCKDADDAKLKGEEIAVKLKSEYAGRITDDGSTRLKVTSGDTYVDIELAAEEFWKNTDENNRLAAGGK